MDNLNVIGRPSTFACPDCDGVLWEIEGSRPPRYRCHTGHAFSLRSLEHTQAEAAEQALWGGIRALQEREVLLRKVAELHRSVGDVAAGAVNETKAERLSMQSAELQRMLEAQ